MAHFEVNLIRDQVVPPKRRRLICRCMLAYLLLCALAMGVVAYRARQEVLVAAGTRAEIAELETRFQHQYPGGGSILQCRRTLEVKLRERAQMLESIDGTLQKQSSLGRLLTHLLLPLPPTVVLSSLELNRVTGVVSFDMQVPVGNGGGGESPTHFVALWAKSAALATQVRDIQLVTTQRVSVEAKPVFVFRYSCKLVNGGS